MNRIEKEIILKAPRARVWRALTDSAEFSTWFKIALDGPFKVGAHTRGNLTEVGYEHLKIDMLVERLEPQHLFSLRWHPYPIDPKVDYSKEPRTLVEFKLEEIAGGTRLTVVESGFEHIPAGRRVEAFRMNTEGWAEQLERVKRYVES